MAASGAKDSSRGLFITDRHLETVFRLPYTIAGVTKGKFNMSQSLNEPDRRSEPPVTSTICVIFELVGVDVMGLNKAFWDEVVERSR